MNKLLQKSEREVIVVDENHSYPIAPYEQRQPATRPQLHTSAKTIKVNVILILAVLLGLISLSFLGPDVAFIGSYILATIPSMICAWIVYKAFGHFGMAAVSGVLIIVLMAYFNTLVPFLASTHDFLMSLSHVSGYLAGLVLAVMIGIAWKR